MDRTSLKATGHQNVRLLLLEDGRCSRSALDWRSVYRLWTGPDLIGHCRAPSMLYLVRRKERKSEKHTENQHGKLRTTWNFDLGFWSFPYTNPTWLPLGKARVYILSARSRDYVVSLRTISVPNWLTSIHPPASCQSLLYQTSQSFFEGLNNTWAQRSNSLNRQLSVQNLRKLQLSRCCCGLLLRAMHTPKCNTLLQTLACLAFTSCNGWTQSEHSSSQVSVIFNFRRILDCRCRQHYLEIFWPSQSRRIRAFAIHGWYLKINHLYIRLVASNLWTAIVGGDAAANTTTCQNSNNAAADTAGVGIFS